jgi:hypothetical protein
MLLEPFSASTLKTPQKTQAAALDEGFGKEAGGFREKRADSPPLA